MYDTLRLFVFNGQPIFIVKNFYGVDRQKKGSIVDLYPTLGVGITNEKPLCMSTKIQKPAAD